MQPISTHRLSITSYVAKNRHIARGATKNLTEIAHDIGTSRATVRRWLRRDHWTLWLQEWASAEELFGPVSFYEDVDSEKKRRLQNLMTDLNASFEELAQTAHEHL